MINCAVCQFIPDLLVWNTIKPGKFTLFCSMSSKSPYKYLRDIKRMTKFTERKIFEPSAKGTLHVRCQTDISQLLTMSQPTIMDIPPKLPKLSLTRIKKISIIHLEPEKPTPQPSQINQLTLEDFVKCVNQSEGNRRQKIKNEEQDRECYLMDFKRRLNFLPS